MKWYKIFILSKKKKNANLKFCLDGNSPVGQFLEEQKSKIYAYIAITCNNPKDIVNEKLRSCQEELTCTLYSGHPAGTTLHVHAE